VRSAEGARRVEEPKALSGVAYEEGCPLSSRLGDLGSVVSSPSGAEAEPRPETHFDVF